MLALEQEQFERDWMPSATHHHGREEVLLLCLLQVIPNKLPQPLTHIALIQCLVISCLVSSVLLTEKMQSREVVPLMRLVS